MLYHPVSKLVSVPLSYRGICGMCSCPYDPLWPSSQINTMFVRNLHERVIFEEERSSFIECWKSTSFGWLKLYEASLMSATLSSAFLFSSYLCYREKLVFVENVRVSYLYPSLVGLNRCPEMTMRHDGSIASPDKIQCSSHVVQPNNPSLAPSASVHSVNTMKF